MPRWPHSLYARLLTVLLAALLGAQLLTLGFVLLERSQTMQAMMRPYLTADLASSLAMLDRLPARERPQWLDLLERPNYRFGLPQSSSLPADHPPSPAQEWATQLAAELQAALQRPVALLDGTDGRWRLQTRLNDRSLAEVELAPPRLRLSRWLVAGLLAQALLMALAGRWAVRQMLAPLERLALAADGYRAGRPGPVLSESGPIEVTRASAAFNHMQARIQRHDAERNQMLAAIAHDLQTPITRMQLRLETSNDRPLQGKLSQDLAQMQTLIAQGLAYARSQHAQQEARTSMDLPSLLESIAADYRDAGHDIRLQIGTTHCAVTTRPQALRRVLENLIDNALKFAGRYGPVELALELASGAGHATAAPSILVMDRGPGIAPEVLAQVTQPFYRTDVARSAPAGGSGLGLAIAKRLASVCDAELTLAARSGGGLMARLQFLAHDASPVMHHRSECAR